MWLDRLINYWEIDKNGNKDEEFGRRQVAQKSFLATRIVWQYPHPSLISVLYTYSIEQRPRKRLDTLSNRISRQRLFNKVLFGGDSPGLPVIIRLSVFAVPQLPATDEEFVLCVPIPTEPWAISSGLICTVNCLRLELLFDRSWNSIPIHLASFFQFHLVERIISTDGKKIFRKQIDGSIVIALSIA